MRHTSHAVPDAAASAVEMPTHRQPHSGTGQPRQQEIQRPSAVQRADGQQIEGAQHPIGPRRRSTPHPAEDRSRQQIRQRPRQSTEQLLSRREVCYFKDSPSGAQAQGPKPAPAESNGSQMPQLVNGRRRALKPADARTRATLPPPAPSAPSANRSRGRTIPPAEKSRRRRYTQAVST